MQYYICHKMYRLSYFFIIYIHQEESATTKHLHFIKLFFKFISNFHNLSQL